MALNPILKVLSTLSTHHVQHLLMGGQACVLYGAAEFSRDTDIALMTEAENLRRLSSALDPLDARRIAVPPSSPEYLQKIETSALLCSMGPGGPAGQSP